MPKEFSIKERKPKTGEQALQSLMTLCAKAEKSSGDAKRLMYRWGVPAEDQAVVIEKLLRDRFIDDSRYASAFVREKLRFSGWGAFKIKMALTAKRIDRSVIDEAMAQLDPKKMKNRLTDSLMKKSRTIKASNDYDRRAKLIRYGLSLGYDYDSVSDAVQQMVNVYEEF